MLMPALRENWIPHSILDIYEQMLSFETWLSNSEFQQEGVVNVELEWCFPIYPIHHNFRVAKNLDVLDLVTADHF